MKQIKTIADYKIKTFDEEVNAAIAEGWDLVKRDCHLVGRDRGPMLYAELEKEVVTEAEQTCENCKHRDDPPGGPHCIDCAPEDNWKWEAEQ